MACDDCHHRSPSDKQTTLPRLAPARRRTQSESSFLTIPAREFNTRQDMLMRHRTSRDAEVRIRPRASRLNLDETAPPRNLASTGTTQFYYDGYDLTGVIQSRTLRCEEQPCRMKREHNAALALKRLVDTRIHQHGNNSYYSEGDMTPSLFERKRDRAARLRPWTEAMHSRPTPAVDKRTFADINTEISRKYSASGLKADIEWYAFREAELEDHKYRTLPHVVLVSSRLQFASSADVISIIKKDVNVLPVEYDFESATYKTVLDAIVTALRNYHHGCKAQSLLVISQGGPGYVFLLHKQMISGPKLKKDQDSQWFWTEIGSLMSKIDPNTTTVFLGGFPAAANRQERKIFGDIQNVMRPNRVKVLQFPSDATTLAGPARCTWDLVETYFESFEQYARLYKL